MHCVLVKMAGNHCFSLNSELQFLPILLPHALAFFFFYASWQEFRILVLFSWGKKCALQHRLYNDSVSLALYSTTPKHYIFKKNPLTEKNLLLQAMLHRVSGLNQGFECGQVQGEQLLRVHFLHFSHLLSLAQPRSRESGSGSGSHRVYWSAIGSRVK